MAAHIKLRKIVFTLYNMTLNDYLILIIDNLEGGYYHPDMQSKLRNGERLGNSGETMYGLDRKAGAGLFVSGPGKEFWQVVDQYYGTHHGDASYYQDKADGKKSDIPATVGQRLKSLAAQTMLPKFTEYSDKYFTPEVKRLVNSYPALTFNFLYAVWNGEGNFKNFANAVNQAYNNGTTDPSQLYEIVQAKRRAKGDTYGIFAAGADIIDRIVESGVLKPAQGGGSFLPWLIVLAAIGIFIYKKSK